MRPTYVLKLFSLDRRNLFVSLNTNYARINISSDVKNSELFIHFYVFINLIYFINFTNFIHFTRISSVVNSMNHEKPVGSTLVRTIYLKFVNCIVVLNYFPIISKIHSLKHIRIEKQFRRVKMITQCVESISQGKISKRV